MKPLSDTYEAPKILRCAHDQLYEPCQTLAKLDVKILETKALLEELEQRRKVTQMQMNQVHNPLIQQVPPEIASSIFTLCVEEGFQWNFRLPLVLASICKKWREITFSTPQLWIGLTIGCTSRMGPPVSLVEQWLSRSGQLPLDIQLIFGSPAHYGDNIQSLTEAIYSHSHRWNSLELSMPVLPVFKADIQVNSSLKNLIISVLGDGNWTFKPENIILHPQKVWLKNISPAHVHIDWINVIDFEAAGIAWTEILYVLQQRVPGSKNCN